MKKLIQKNKKLSFAIAILLCFTIIFAPVLTSAAEDSSNSIKVAYYPSYGFWQTDSNGVESGYCADYLYSLSQYMDKEIEYVHYNSLDEAVQGVYSGGADILMPTIKSEWFDTWASYSKYELFQGYNALITLDTREDLVYEDYNKISTITVGIIDQFNGKQEFEDWLKEKQLNTKIEYAQNYTQLYDMLNSGKVDAIVTNIANAEKHTKILEKLGQSSAYILASKENSYLLDIISSANSKLVVENHTFYSDLFNKYFKKYVYTPFSKAEIEYAQKNPPLKIGCAVNRFPVCYLDNATGEVAGIMPSILKRIEQISGLTFELVPLPTDQTVDYNYLRDNNIELVSGAEYTGYVKSSYGMVSTLPYLYANKVLVARESFDYNFQNIKIASSSDSVPSQQRLNIMFPNCEIVFEKDAQACLDAVKSGKADITFENEYSVMAYLRGPRYAKLITIPGYVEEYGECMSVILFQNGIGKANPMLEDGRLVSRINKAIALMTKEEINAFITSATIQPAYEYTFYDNMIVHPVQTAIIFACIVAAVFAILFLIYRAHRQSQVNKVIAQKNKQLQQAIVQAQNASTSKSQFLARMSHEIRTPMNAIVGITTIAKKYINQPEKISEYLEKISASSKILLNLINDVLDMSAIESEKLRIANNKFDFKELITNITTLYYSQCKSKGVKFSVGILDISEEILVGDSLRLNQILLNLLSNAYKFTHSGGQIKVVISQQRKDSNKIYLSFVVKDTGEGISPELMQRLFKPFEQENEETAKFHGGSGLGLSITKNLVELMHGSISVESEKGKGTTFTVNLPFGYEAMEQSGSDKFKNIKALIVDDDADAREYASIVLERLGIQHDIAGGGNQAIDILQNAFNNGKGYDICFIDWKMQDVDGIEVTKKIRQLYDKDTIIIIVSAFDLSEVEDEATSAGANMFVTKPMFQSTVFNVLMSITGGKYSVNNGDSDNYDFKGKTILLAEDNALNMEIAVELLNMTGAAVECAENGKIAVDKFVNSTPGTYSAILMDIQMPITNGHEAAKLIRFSSHKEASTIPIYAMTANAFTEDISAALSCGMNGHISKPIDTAVLYSTLDKCFKEKE